MDFIKVSEIVIEGFNPIHRTTKTALRGLREQIREAGRILVPIVLTPDKRLVDGHRRIAVAIELGIEEVPYITLSGDPRELFSMLNNNQSKRNMLPTEWLDFYLNDGVVPRSNTATYINALEKIIGKSGLRELAKRGISPGVYQSIVRVSEYCDDRSHAFMVRVMWWLINHRMTHTSRKAIEAGLITPQALVDAITEDRPLVLKSEYS